MIAAELKFLNSCCINVADNVAIICLLLEMFAGDADKVVFFALVVLFLLCANRVLVFLRCYCW